MLGRRGFLSLLGLAGIAPFLPKIPEVLALPDTLIYEPELIKAVVPEIYQPVGLVNLTKAMAIEFEREYRRLGGKPIATHDVIRLGEKMQTMNAPVATKQYNVAMHFLPGETTQVMERFVRPAAHSLASRAVQDGINRFGALTVPAGGAEVAQAKNDVICIRGIWQYDISYDVRSPLRFDIIGGRA